MTSMVSAVAIAIREQTPESLLKLSPIPSVDFPKTILYLSGWMSHSKPEYVLPWDTAEY